MPIYQDRFICPLRSFDFCPYPSMPRQLIVHCARLYESKNCLQNSKNVSFIFILSLTRKQFIFILSVRTGCTDFPFTSFLHIERTKRKSQNNFSKKNIVFIIDKRIGLIYFKGLRFYIVYFEKILRPFGNEYKIFLYRVNRKMIYFMNFYVDFLFYLYMERKSPSKS